jgi:hypothetical protein
MDMRETKDMAQLVGEDGEQVHSALLALVARKQKLDVVPGRAVKEPTMSGCVAV